MQNPNGLSLWEFYCWCSGNRISSYTCISTRKVTSLLKTVNSLLQEEWSSVVQRDVGMMNCVQSKKKKKKVPQNIRIIFLIVGIISMLKNVPRKIQEKWFLLKFTAKLGNILKTVLSWPHRERNTSNFHDFITFRAAASIFKNVLYNIPHVSSKQEHLSSIFIRAVYQPIFFNQKGILLKITERKQTGRWLTKG